MSLYITGLITIVSLDNDAESIGHELESDICFHRKRSHARNIIMEISTFCFENTNFEFVNNFYEQEFLITMGSSLSAVNGYVFMDDSEEFYLKSKQNTKNMLILCRRYFQEDNFFLDVLVDRSKLYLSNVSEGKQHTLKDMKFFILTIT